LYAGVARMALYRSMAVTRPGCALQVGVRLSSTWSSVQVWMLPCLLRLVISGNEGDRQRSEVLYRGCTWGAAGGSLLRSVMLFWLWLRCVVAVTGPHPIGCIWPPVGICGAVSLLVMTRSYLKAPPWRHWPPTSGVLATFLTGPAPQAMGPTIVSSLVLVMASSTAARSPACERLRASAATSKSACTNPIGWVHCFLTAAM